MTDPSSKSAARSFTPAELDVLAREIARTLGEEVRLLMAPLRAKLADVEKRLTDVEDRLAEVEMHTADVAAGPGLRVFKGGAHGP